MEKAFYPRQDREKAVISNLLPKLSKDTVDEGLGLLKISSVVDGTNIRGTGICHNHSYRWRMAIESAVQSIAVVPDRFFDIKGKSYPIDWNRKVSVASLPTYNNYKDAVIYKINSHAKCVIPPAAKIIFDNNMENKGVEETIPSLTYTGTTKTISLGKLFKENKYSILENGAIKKEENCYIPYRSLSTKINGTDSNGEYEYTVENEKVYKITDEKLKESILAANEINYDIEAEGTLVSYLENAATTELFSESGGITDTLGSVEAVSEITEIENGDYLAIIVDNNDNYYALIGTKSLESNSKNIIVTWAQPAIPVDTFQFKGLDMWLRFDSINELIYFLITKYENDIISIDPATIDGTATLESGTTKVTKNEDGESKKLEGKLWAYVNPRTMTPYPDDYWFHQGEPYYVKSLTLAPKNKKLKGNRIIVKADQWPGMYMMVGETYIRDRDTGEDERMQIKFPLCKVKSDQTLTLQADGDPTTFNLDLEVARPANGVMMELTAYEVSEKLLEGDDGCFYAVDGSTEVLSE